MLLDDYTHLLGVPATVLLETDRNLIVAYCSPEQVGVALVGMRGNNLRAVEVVLDAQTWDQGTATIQCVWCDGTGCVGCHGRGWQPADYRLALVVAHRTPPHPPEVWEWEYHRDDLGNLAMALCPERLNRPAGLIPALLAQPVKPSSLSVETLMAVWQEDGHGRLEP